MKETGLQELHHVGVQQHFHLERLSYMAHKQRCWPLSKIMILTGSQGRSIRDTIGAQL